MTIVSIIVNCTPLSFFDLFFQFMQEGFIYPFPHHHVPSHFLMSLPDLCSPKSSQNPFWPSRLAIIADKFDCPHNESQGEASWSEETRQTIVFCDASIFSRLTSVFRTFIPPRLSLQTPYPLPRRQLGTKRFEAISILPGASDRWFLEKTARKEIGLRVSCTPSG